MIKRIILFLLISILILCLAAVSIYYINPFGVKTENIRPRLFGFDIYRIPSKSMQPLLYPGDYILVSNTAYLETKPNKQDVVVFFKPAKETAKPEIQLTIPYIKRVLALAGETVEIKKGELLINNEIVKEEYVLKKNIKTSYSQKMPQITIPENHVFLLGDNRDNSSDSRIYGSIVETDILAKATSILYGINHRSGVQIK